MAPQSSRESGLCVEALNVEYTPDLGMTQRRASELFTRIRNADLGPTNRTYCLLASAPDAVDNTLLALIVRSKNGVNSVVAGAKYLMSQRRTRLNSVIEVQTTGCFGQYYWSFVVGGGESTVYFAPANGAPDWPVSIRYQTIPGTLTPGVDYVPKSGLLSWLAGDGGVKSVSFQTLSSPNAGYFDVKITHLSDAISGPHSTFRIYKDMEPTDQQGANPPLTASPNFIVAPRTFDVTAKFHTVLPLAERVMFLSSKDRAVVFRQGWWYPEGLLAPLEPGILSSTPASGYAMAGTWIATWCYVDAHTPGGGYSNFSPESNELTISNDQALVFTPPLVNGQIQVRDFRQFMDGSDSPAFTHWFVYIRNKNSGEAYEVAYKTFDDPSPVTITAMNAANLAIGRRVAPRNPPDVRRVAPGYGLGAFDGNCVWKAGTEDIYINAALTLTNGDNIATLTGPQPFSDNHLGKMLVVDGLETNHAIEEILSPTQVRLRNSQGVGWLYATQTAIAGSWFLQGSKTRVIRSHYGPTANGMTLSAEYEAFPAVNEFSNEFDPQDGNMVNGLIAVPNGLVVCKPNGLYRISNSVQTDSALLKMATVVPITRGIGLMCPRTLCKDGSGMVYMLSSSGPARVFGNEIQQLSLQFVKNIITQILTFNNVNDPTGEFDPVRGLFLIGGLQRSGANGGLTQVLAIDGMTGAMTIDKYPRETTCLFYVSGYEGANQGALIRCDNGGYLSRAYTENTYIDDYLPAGNWMEGTPHEPNPQPVVAEVLTQPMTTNLGRIAQVYWLQTADVAEPYDGYLMELAAQAKTRTSDSALIRNGILRFVPSTVTAYNLDGKHGRIALSPLSGDAIQWLLKWSNSVDRGRPITLKSLTMLVNEFPGLVFGPSGKQTM
jgi:hypothetical protein